MAELVDAPDLGSGVPRTCRFESCSRYVSLFEEVRSPAALESRENIGVALTGNGTTMSYAQPSTADRVFLRVVVP